MTSAERAQRFIDQAVAQLATSLGFHPVDIACPALAVYAQLAEHVLLREHPDGTRQMVVLMPHDGATPLADALAHVTRFARDHAELTASMRLRIACVVIASPLPTRAERKLLKPTRMLDDHVVIRRFWLSLGHRRMVAPFSPWGFAPSFELNPCDPDDNLFVALVRNDRYLNTPPAPALTEEVHRRALARERSFLSGLSGRNLLVWTLLAVNILVWILLETTGGSRRPDQLIRAGAKSNGLIRAGQTWRLVTPIFLHYGLFHLVLNSVGLLILGEVIEHIYGSRQFALLYFASGIISVVASFWFGGALMVGASGAIFGLAGALAVYGYRYRRRIPRRYSAMFGGGILPIIGINLLFGFMVKGIDNSAHIGGLLAGTAVALLMRPLADASPGDRRPSLRGILALVLSGVVVGCVVAGGFFFVRFVSITQTDVEWTLRTELPGGVTLCVPATWVGGSTEDAAVYQSVCYSARLEVIARDVSRGLPAALNAELARIAANGFIAPGPTSLAEHLEAITSRRRYPIRMLGARGWEREQVFIWFKSTGTLVSIGVEVPERDKLRFVPVQEKLLSLLPVFEPRPPR